MYRDVPPRATKDLATKHHYDQHSRTLPITECNQIECRRAVREFRMKKKEN